MSSKRIYFFLAILTALILVGCGPAPEIVNKTPIDNRYTPAYEAVETNYKHQYSWGANEFVLVPEVSTIYHHETYEVLYLVAYDDGSERQAWETVTKTEYLEIDALLTGGSHAPDD